MAQSKAYDANAGQWPIFSGFRPLDRASKEIRVLQLIQDSTTDELCYNMHNEKLTASPDFSALSYSWGAPVPPAAQKRIIIDNQLVLIRPILYSFLQTLAMHDPDVNLWIDAVCINQADTDERNHQISMMADVFRLAENVYVWLGPGDDDTNYAFEHIKGNNLQTPFDQRQFVPCMEKVFRSSYWTRRWVIQEFALAQKLYIACGMHVTTWQEMVQKVDRQILKDDVWALRKFDSFTQLAQSIDEHQSSLLELMLTFQESRCIDRRDKAFALRGIAKDGFRLKPDYNESVGDLYFRTLSLQPLTGVLPESIGYRWPHKAAGELWRYLQLETKDLVASLKTAKPSDRLFATFEYVGTAVAVKDAVRSGTSIPFPKLVSYQTGDKHSRTSLGSNGLKPGDLIYSLRTSPRSPRYILVAFRGDMTESTVIGFVTNVEADLRERWNQKTDYLGIVMTILVSGVSRCSEMGKGNTSHLRVLCHISRMAMLLLWFMDKYVKEQVDLHLQFLEQFLPDVQSNPAKVECETLCQCLGEEDERTKDVPLEILPSYHIDTANESTWSATHEEFWSPSEQGASWSLLENDISRKANNYPLDFLRHGRSDLSYAVEEGLIRWAKVLLAKNPEDADRPDHMDNTPLMWAIEGGHKKTVDLLLRSPNVNPTVGGSEYETPLMRAIQTGSTEIVKTLLDSQRIDPSFKGRSSRSPLSQAAQAGLTEIVKALLSYPNIDSDVVDADGSTPILRAARSNHGEVVKILLATNQITDYNRKSVDGRNVLTWLAEYGDVDNVKRMLSIDDVDPDRMDSERWTPLRYAWKGKHKEIYNLLVATGRVDLNVPKIE